MSWKYEVFVCAVKNANSHGLYCDEQFESAGEFWDYGFIDAFHRAHELAERDGHAMVQSTSPHTGKALLAYQHIRGGGLCEECPPRLRRRGLWMNGLLGDRFICEPCAAQRRREWGKRNGWPDTDCTWYRPVIENAAR
ncbi:hypothetical protein ACWD5Q_32080 [Streptomyces sp. NPDC002513]